MNTGQQAKRFIHAAVAWIRRLVRNLLRIPQVNWKSLNESRCSLAKYSLN